MATPQNDLLYVYCAVRGRLTKASVAKLPPMPGGSAPRVIALTDDISLVAADVPADTYRGDAIEAHFEDLDWVGRCGAAHHAVSDQLATKHTVVPFRLFTLFSSETRATAALGRTAKRIDEALNRVKDRAEWVLRISKPDPAASGAATKRSGKTAAASGTAFLKSKAAAKQAATEVAARVRHDAAAVFDALDAVADESSQRSLEASMGLLLDAAFLVPVRQTATFKRELSREAAGLLRDGCRVSLTGPWPPYSFVSLETTRG